MRELQGKVCVVTGGAGGIGLAMAERFHRAGMKVVLGDVEGATLEQVVGRFGDDGLAVDCDVTSAPSMDALRDAALDRFGAVHLVCLNAGVAPSGPVADTSLDSWRWVFDVNVFGVVHGVRSFVAGLVAQSEGHVVCTASAAGLVTTPGLGAYSATKHAVVAIAATLRDELASAGVGVSVLCPGILRTRIFESERNRPDGRADDAHADPASMALFVAALHAAPGPEVAAEAVHDAVVDDRLWVLPSPEINPLLERRLTEVRAAMPS